MRREKIVQLLNHGKRLLALSTTGTTYELRQGIWVPYVENVTPKPKGAKRVARGEDNPRAILTEARVRHIKKHLAAETMTQAGLADHHGCGRSTISHIKTGRIWRHVTI